MIREREGFSLYLEKREETLVLLYDTACRDGRMLRVMMHGRIFFSNAREIGGCIGC